MSTSTAGSTRGIRSVGDEGPLHDSVSSLPGDQAGSSRGRDHDNRTDSPPPSHRIPMRDSMVSPTDNRGRAGSGYSEADDTPISAARSAAVSAVLQAKLSSQNTADSPLSRLGNLTKEDKITESLDSQVIDWMGFPVSSKFLEHYELAQGKTAESIARVRQRWVQFTSRPNEPNAEPELSIELCYNVRYAEELSSLIHTAVPHEHRVRLWMIKSGALVMMRDNPEMFRSLVLCNLNAPAPASEQIRADLPRTLPHHDEFINHDGEDRLYRVLSAFAWRNPDIGYCQGQNMVAAVLNLVASDQETFWLLNAISSSAYFPDMYAPNLAGLQTDTRVLGHLVRLHLGDIHRKLQSLGVALELVTSKWFLTLFAGLLPSDTLMRTWDHLFAEGPHTFFHVVLGVISSHRIELLAAVSVDDAVTILNEAPLALYNFDALANLVTPRMRDQMTREMVGELRKHHREIVDRDLAKLAHKREVVALRQCALHQKFEVDDIEQLNLEFRAVANDRNQINQDQFIQLMKPLVKVTADSTLVQVFKNFDRNKDNSMDFRELLLGLVVISSGNVAERLRLVFHAFDIDSSGFISKDEFLQMLQTLDGTVCDRLTAGSSHQAYVDRMFPNLDLNRDGKLDFHEFERACAAHPQLIQCFALTVRDSEFHDRVSQRASSQGAEYDIVDDAQKTSTDKSGRSMCDNCVIS